MTQVATPQRGGATARGARPRKKLHRTFRLFLVDALIAILFALVLNVPLTGLALHEWLGIVIAVGTAAHLIQHSDWLRTTTHKLRSTAFKNQVNGVMTILLFVSFATVIGSGLVVSEVALPWLGIDTSGTAPFWLWLHLSSVAATIWLTAVHIALNWKWIGSTTNRYVVEPVLRWLDLEDW